MNAADKAQIETAKWNSEMARRDAGNVMASARENATRFTESAEKQLAYGVTMLAKTGNLGSMENALPVSGIDVGATGIADLSGLQAQKVDLEKQLAAIPKSTGNAGQDFITQAFQRSPLEDQLKKVNEQLAALDTTTVRDIHNPDALTFASGSDLLTMVTTRDAMERDKRTLIRNAQTGAMTALKAGEHYDEMAGYAQEAAQWNTWSTILGTGISIVGMAAGLGWAPFATKAAAKVAGA